MFRKYCIITLEIYTKVMILSVESNTCHYLITFNVL